MMCPRCDAENHEGYHKCRCCGMTHVEAGGWAEQQALLPTADVLDMTESVCPPPDHAEKCRRMAQDMANAERLLYRLANGDRQAAIELQGLSEHRPYDGAVLSWRIENLLANVLGTH